jgi:hypothetical protein
VAVAPGAPAETQGRNDRPERDKPVNADLIEEFAVLLFQAPLVVSSRMQDFAFSGAFGGSSEMGRMVTEKLAAAMESVSAVNVALVKEGIDAAAGFAMGTSAGLAGASDRVAVAALKPYGERVRANVLRLSK